MDGLDIRVVGAVAEVPGAHWDALVAHERDRATPFVGHGWLDALESSGTAAAETGWSARHLLLRRAGRLVAAVPAWVRWDSDGDFGRDWDWAAAAERAGIPYFPKLVVGVPFTPVTGRRLLAAPGEDRAALVRVAAAALRELCAQEEVRSIHVLHLAADEAALWERAGLAVRLDFQYHWVNAGYRTFDDFLARFPSRRRNSIRRERAAPEAQGIAIRTVPGAELLADVDRWAEDVERLHEASVSQLAWGRRFVGRRFYERVIRAAPGDVQVVEARRGGRLVAMAFNALSGERLYGRYWGAVEEHPFLHFNVALYHSVEACIRDGRRVFEGGAGGEHKLVRGFEPAEVYSAHLFLDERLDRPLRRHLAGERAHAEAAVARWRAATPVLRPVAAPR